MAAREVARRFGVQAYALDNLFWDNAADRYGTKAEARVRDEELARIVAGEGWVIEGVYYQWVGPSFRRAEVIVVMTTPRRVRQWRVVRRFVRRKLGAEAGKRESLGDLWRLLVWNRAYDADNLARAKKMIRGIGREVVECRSAREVVEAVERYTRGRAIAAGG